MYEPAEPQAPPDDPPIGTIVMWGSPKIPRGWVLCNGSSLSPDAYPHATSTAGAPFHRSADGTVSVPDLRGFFVRGVDPWADSDPDAERRIDMFDHSLTAASQPYSLQMSAFASHGHNYNGFPVSTSARVVCTPDNSYWGGRLAGHAVGGGRSKQQGSSKESRPLNLYLYFIIYVGASDEMEIEIEEVPAPPEGQAALGTIALWGGSAPPPGWLVCNGNQYPAPDKSDYAELRRLLGTSFGQQPKDQLVVPNLQGQFIRGVDSERKRDPDYGSRQRPDGQSDVGSIQGDAFQSHSHGFTQFPKDSDWWSPVAQDLGGDCYHDAGISTGATGDAETRPLNAAFYYVIKASRFPSAVSTLPVGAIAMWPSANPPLGWLLCNGRAYQYGDDPGIYDRLHDVIQDQFRPDWSPQAAAAEAQGSFYVPNLQGLFVRGLDDATPARDPDRDSRTDLLGKTKIGPVLGSLQQCALAAHDHSVSSYPGDWTPSGQRFGATTFSGWVGGDATTNPAGGAETRPRNVYLFFIIKYSD